MKECPSCKRVYADDTLNFCLSDGTSLTVLPDPAEATLVLPASKIAQEAVPTKQGVNPLFAYLAIGLIALIAGGALVAWMKSEPNLPSSNNNAATVNKGIEPNKVVESPISNRANNATANTSRSPSPADTSAAETEAKAALDGWVKTLIDHDLNQHLSFYADRLDLYRNKRDASIADVRKYNEYLFNKYSEFHLKPQNVKAESTGDGQVTIRFESVFDFRGPKPYSGLDRRTEMRWRNVDGVWKIVVEK